MPVKNARDLTRLSGKPLSETLEPSKILANDSEEWVTSADLLEPGLNFTPETIYDLAVFLIGNPNRNSSIVFRADILFDSFGALNTPKENEDSFARGNNLATASGEEAEAEVGEPLSAISVPGFELTRTVVRRFIPRNPKLDKPLDQSCYFYEKEEVVDGGRMKRLLVVYTPHVKSKEEMPFYHPILRGLAYLYDFTYNADTTQGMETGTGTMSIHFLPYPAEQIQNRLERTLLSLINTQIRLARGTKPTKTPEGGNHNPTKDNLIPRHLVQNTYSRLKLKHAEWLCQNWVENTEPSKHVFEDLAITAFLIELWRGMYGVAPVEERGAGTGLEREKDGRFPGFVDIACGNGVLVYILAMEGYAGWGFDARHRKTWKIFPEDVQARLKEAICIPRPFADELASRGEGELDIGVETHLGIFSENTFIISNHADELTVWTPILAALSNPNQPLPFLAIPCCSHSLSGARFRYPPPGKSYYPQGDEQSATGDLKALRAAKEESQTDAGALKSMYGCLTAKAINIATEVGYDAEKTMLRIPSTRNMGVVGGRKQTTQLWGRKFNDNKQAGSIPDGDSSEEALVERSWGVVRRECSKEGGVEAAARIWVERAKGLNLGQGKGGHKD